MLSIGSGAAFGQAAAGWATLQSNHSFLESTYMLDLRQGSELSRRAQQLAEGGYELSGGKYQSFRSWYSTRWTDVHIAWITQVNKNFGIIFGLSTGERGEKYVIDPSFMVGFIAQKETSRNAFLTFKASTTLGGYFSEKSCTADYGDIGGVQDVNCRLAATTLRPTDTLAYLVRERPANQVQLSFSFNLKF